MNQCVVRVESTKIDFIGVIKDAAGKQVANVRDYADFKLKDATAAQLSGSNA